MIFNCFSFGSHIESNFSFFHSFVRSFIFSIRFELQFFDELLPGQMKNRTFGKLVGCVCSLFNVFAEKANASVPEIDTCLYIYVGVSVSVSERI